MKGRAFSAAAAAMVCYTGATALLPVHAAPLPSSSTIGPASELSRPAEKVLCYGYGWRGWGYYPGWFRPACSNPGPAYVAPGSVVVPAPAYVAPAPVAGRCWVPPDTNGRPGYWAPC
jgi:hypothetical protein